MPDREKVIKGLECCLVSYEDRLVYQCDDCPYRATADERKVIDWHCHLAELRSDALELLKAQEPRVLSLEEVLDGGECWFDYINGSCGYANIDMQDNKTAIIYRNNRRPVEVPITDYMKKWRCWSYRPTDEQRKAVKCDAADGGWISVKDRLPEETSSMFARFYATEKWYCSMWKNESEAVLVYVRFPDGGRKVTTGRLHDGKWNTTVSKILPHEVTHWMPLPPGPEVDK